jgi:hypothetical protein
MAGARRFERWMNPNAPRTIRSVPQELGRSETRSEPTEEGNLLVEAVALLVQRQRETETWVAEQVWQAEERAAATERHYAELDARLKEIEEHLARLTHQLEPARGRADDERLARLREQVEGLKSAPNGFSAQPGSSPGGLPIEPTAVPHVESEGREGRQVESAAREGRQVETTRVIAAPGHRLTGARGGARAAAGNHKVQFWELLGSTPQDRVGFILMSVGGVAVLYAILSQLRF